MNEIEKDVLRLEIYALLDQCPALRQALRNIEQVVWVRDSRTDRILYVSPAFERVWGCSRESLYANPLTLINSVHPEDRVKVMAAYPDDHRKSVDLTYRILQPGGDQRWISAHTFVVQEESTGDVLQICVAQDVTDQNQVDETLRKSLDRSREQFTLSRRMSLARRPEAVLKTLMYASELRAAKRAFLLFVDTPTNAPSHEMEVIAAWAPIVNLADAYAGETAGDVKLSESGLFEDQSLIDLFHPAKPVVVSDIANDSRLTLALRNKLLEEKVQTIAIFPLVALGDWLGCLVVFFATEKRFKGVDIRHVKVLVDQATITLYNLHLLEIEEESRHEAERANEIKTEFLAMISHELRTPLTSIIGFTTTLLAQDIAWEPDEGRDFIMTIQQEANRLEELIDHLLDLSRLEAGMLPISQKVHSLGKIITDALPQIQVLTRGQTVILHIPANLPPVYVDDKRVAQVLVNLVHNAAVYAPQGTEISISANVRGGFVRVNVNDQGPGIPPAEHKKVFKAFQRGENIDVGPVKGAGLGLAICKGLVEAHGGRIWIKKKNSPGATISFTLPLVPPGREVKGSE